MGCRLSCVRCIRGLVGVGAVIVCLCFVCLMWVLGVVAFRWAVLLSGFRYVSGFGGLTFWVLVVWVGIIQVPTKLLWRVRLGFWFIVLMDLGIVGVDCILVGVLLCIRVLVDICFTGYCLLNT